MGETIRVTAISDLHFGKGRSEYEAVSKTTDYRQKIDELAEESQLILVAGDWTDQAEPYQARLAAYTFRDSPIPVIGVLGNHDRPKDNPGIIKQILEEEGGIKILEGDVYTYMHDGFRVDITGVLGFSHDYSPARFGKNRVSESEYEDLIEQDVDSLAQGISGLHGDRNIVLLHYPHVTDPDNSHAPWRVPPKNTLTIDKIVAKNSRRIDFVLHGDRHSEPNPQKFRNGVNILNIASQPVTIEMTSEVPVIIGLR